MDNTNTKSSLRDHILSQTKLPTESVTAFGRLLHVRTMSGNERDGFEQSVLDAKEKGETPNIRGLLAALCIVDKDQKRVFTDEDAKALGQLNAKELDRVFSKATQLNGIGKDDVAELEGNSARADGDDFCLTSATVGDAPSESCSPESTPES